MQKYIFICCALIFTNLCLANTAQTAAYFDSIKNQPASLLAFTKQMPKGAELHLHLTGSVFPEDLIDIGASEDYCINPLTLSPSKTPGCKGLYPMKEVGNNNKLYNKLVNAWSLQFPSNNHQKDISHFFSAFLDFSPLVQPEQGKMLAATMNQAARDHINYLELITYPDPDSRTDQFKKLAWTGDFKQQQDLLDKNGAHEIAKQDVEITNNFIKTARKTLKCDTAQAQPGCKVAIKFLYYSRRNLPLNVVFAETYIGFLVNQLDDDYVGMNIVNAENDRTAINDYEKHMAVFHYFHQQFPHTHITLHAGELTIKVTSPENLSFHVRSAIEHGDAERIGHGSDIPYETNVYQLLQEMKEKQIAVEINLTSNQEILGLQPKDNPLLLYLNHQVPVTLSTDDPGLLLTTLSTEYQKAALNFDLSYQQLKNIDRNSLYYSFLPGKNLWANNQYQKFVKPCETTTPEQAPTRDCQDFLNSNKKAALQWQLEKQLTQFEKQWS